MTEQASERPITFRQLGAIIGEFRRLGLAYPTWREYRLDIAAVFTGRAGLDSTKDLAFGEAGLLLNRLRRCRDCRDLAAFLAAHIIEERRAG
jgi:hypothetical protein